jgi:hypothetical protein
MRRSFKAAKGLVLVLSASLLVYVLNYLHIDPDGSKVKIVGSAAIILLRTR